MTFRACIVGAEIGGEHCKGYAKLADRFTMHPVCDLNEERGLALAGKFGAAFTRNLNVAILDSEFDVIDVCWPSHAHFQTRIDALDTQKVVHCKLFGQAATAC